MPARPDRRRAPEPDALAAEIRRRVRGEVRADAAARALFATDASNHRHVPLAVVAPRDADDVVAAIETCRDLGVPVLARGAGTSLAGQACNVAVVLDFTRSMRSVVALDAEARTARVQPGCVLDALQLAARPHGLRFGPDPSSHDRCTLGGMIANDACGARSLVHGRTSAHVAALDVALQDGTRLRAEPMGDDGLAAWAREAGRRGALARDLLALRDDAAPLVRARFPSLRRRVSGYALDALLPEAGADLARALCGTEGTCAVTLEATVRLVPVARATSLAVLGYADVAAAAEAVPGLLAAGDGRVTALEAVEATLLRGLPPSRRAALPEGGAWLYVETEAATPAEAAALAAGIARRSGAPAVLPRESRHVRLLWLLREAGVGATARLPDGTPTAPGWEDAAVPPDRLPGYLRAFRELLAQHGLRSALYGHFGEGCVHARITFALGTPDGRARYRSFLDDAADLVVAHGGSLSGEHGDGQARGRLLERMYGAELVAAFGRFKRAWDPAGLLNPGKIVEARAPDDDLRAEALAPAAATALGRDALGCVGVGACLRESPGVMCPSRRATGAEEHSPRGRSRLLAELLAGGVAALRDDDVDEALGLCLGCKACATECPAGVDVAWMKAEFLALRHRDVPRPPEHRLARVDRALRIASRAPALARALSALPPVRALLERWTGLSSAAALPPIAAATFHERVEELGRPPRGGRPITLLVDTFTNHLDPEAGLAAVRVLRRAGFAPRTPELPCCGRPLLDVGRLDEAREQLRGLAGRLPRDGSPIVGLEPACVSMLRHDAARLGVTAPHVAFLSEWAVAEGLALTRATLVQPHCHERALSSPDALAGLGPAVDVLDAGCCGMAGAFGLASRTRGVSLAVGELAVLPALRRADAAALVVSDGFSCRRRALEGAGRTAITLAQALEISNDDD